jgi:hypothetical protein
METKKQLTLRPRSDAELRYCEMIVRFLDLLADVEHPRRTRALAREMDRTETALGWKRARELEEWVFAQEKETSELKEWAVRTYGAEAVEAVEYLD